MAVPDWSFKPPEWSQDTYALLMDTKVNHLQKEDLQDFINKSETFQIKFPVDTGRCKTLKNHVPPETLHRNINSVYPLVHENALELYCKFILFKRKYGTKIEKAVYKDLNLKQFIDRLLKNRAVMFMGRTDKYLLPSGQKGENKWEIIGTNKESPPLILKDFISYDEIKLSAFLSVSSYTYFINKGDRKNMSKFSNERSDIAAEGVIVGVIGSRLKKVGVMEYQEIVASRRQNTKDNGYGKTVEASTHKLFAEFYEEECLDYNETIELKSSLGSGDRRYLTLNESSVFDNHYYYKRMTVSIDTLLLEANYRAKDVGKTAFVHVVGLGLGVWRISSHQEEIFMEIFAKRIQNLGTKLDSVSDICFAWINQNKCGDCKNEEKFLIRDHPLGGIKILINKRNPHEKLEEDNKLLVVSYAWDGNALPGNEYWSGKLGSSGDSAAASSSQITEIHNPHINSLVCADNLKIITSDGLITLEAYQERIRSATKINKLCKKIKTTA